MHEEQVKKKAIKIEWLVWMATRKKTTTTTEK